MTSKRIARAPIFRSDMDRAAILPALLMLAPALIVVGMLAVSLERFERTMQASMLAAEIGKETVRR